MSDALNLTKAILAELVAFPTVSSEGNTAVSARIAEMLEGWGARVALLPDADGRNANVFATLGPEGDGGLVLSGHTDVVPVDGQNWTSDPFALTERNGHLIARGACDMKGFVAAAMALAPEIAALPLTRPVHFAFTYDEEIGCFGAQALAGLLARQGPRPAMAIVGEPTQLSVIEAHKGCFEYTTRFTGRAGHGSTPEKGANAVEAAARFVAELGAVSERLRSQAPDDSPFEPPFTTINVGRFIGGTARNVIAPDAQVDWEMRPVRPEDAIYVKDHMAAFSSQLETEMRAAAPESSVSTEVVGEVAGLQPSPNNPLRDTLLELTGATDARTVSFGTEAGIFQEIGMSVVVCGPGDIAQAHTPDEYIETAQLDACLDLLRKAVVRLAT